MKSYRKRKYLHIPKFIYIYFSKFQCTSHQLVSVADLGWRVNHVKLLISLCLQNLYFFLNLLWGEAAAPPPSMRPCGIIISDSYQSNISHEESKHVGLINKNCNAEYLNTTECISWIEYCVIWLSTVHGMNNIKFTVMVLYFDYRDLGINFLTTLHRDTFQGLNLLTEL